MTLIFPTLIGLGYNVVRRPKGSTSVQPHVSGFSYRAGYWTYPMYEWDLIFNVLRDFARNAIPSELKRLQGFFLTVQGSYIPFYFQDPDDFQVFGQAIGIGNGTTTQFIVVRTYGDSSYGATITEPIGFIGTLTVYVDGVTKVIGTDYSVVGSPGAIAILFTSAPAAAAVITADISYYFFVRFLQDSLDFDKFSGPPGSAYWQVKKLTLMSLRSEVAILSAPVSPPPPTPAVVIITFSPPNPIIPDNTPLGTTVSTLTINMSDGSSFTGLAPTFVAPDFDDGGRFIITGPSSGPGPYLLVLNPSGPGLPLTQSIEHVTISATQA